MDLLQSLLSNVWAVFLVVFFFGSSIFVHELGHFLAARARGVVVERFSIGFGPPIFSWRGKDGVEYWLSWFPLGGYVKLPQLADLRGIEGESARDLAALPPPSYLSKLIVFVSGAVFNLIFAFLLACVLWGIGFPVRSDVSTTRVGYVMQTLKLSNGTKQTSPASKAGLKAGDVILAVDGRKIQDWAGLTQALALGSGRTAQGERLVQLMVKRGDEVKEIDVNPVIADDEKIRRIGIAPAHDIILGQLPAESPASKIGLQVGDRITAVDTIPLLSLAQLGEYLEAHAATSVNLQVKRGAAGTTIAVPPQKPGQDLFAGAEFNLTFQLVHQDPFSQFNTMLANTIQSIASVFNPRSDIGISKMSGPIGIVQQFWQAATSEYPLRIAMWFTIMINISLALFNLLPIPVLDGGHIMFATIGKIRGRALPMDFINAAQSVFIVLIFSMLIYVSFYDVRRIMRTDKSEPAATPPPTPAAVPAPAPAAGKP